MAHLLIRHDVEDFETWKSAFDDHADFRAEHGSLGGIVTHVEGDPDEVVAVMEWDELENAHGFVDSEGLQEAMAEAGVVGEPEIAFLEDVGEFEH